MSDNVLTGPFGLCRSRPGGVWSYRISIAGKGRIKVTTKTNEFERACEIAGQAHKNHAAKAETNARLGIEPMKFDRACDLWMEEQAPQMREKHLEGQVNWLKKKVGSKYLHLMRAGDISAIRNARMVTVRNVTRRINGKLIPVALRDKAGKPQPVSSATVNKTLRLVSRIVNYAASNHDAEVRRFKWADFYLKTAKPKPKPISRENEIKIYAALREDFIPLTGFAIVSALRANENLVRKDQVDFEHNKLTDVVSKTHPEGRDVPLSDAEMAIIRQEYFRDGNDTDYVFTYGADTTRKVGRTDRTVVKGRRYPITYHAWKAQWLLMRKRTGLKVTIHQLRHTAASRALKATGNLRAVQEMCGHSTPAITARHYGEADAAMISNAKQAATIAPVLAPMAPEMAPERKKTKISLVK